MELDNQEFSTLLFCAFRYALGRKTYVSSEISDIIAKCVPDMTGRLKLQMAQEIELALRNDTAGMDCDREIWVKLLGGLKGD